MQPNLERPNPTLALDVRHGIPEVWIVGLADRVLELFPKPRIERCAAGPRLGKGTASRTLVPEPAVDPPALLSG